MAVTSRLCDRCRNKLTKTRLATVAKKRVKLCGKCEPIVGRERRQELHDRRVTRNGFTGEDYWKLFEAQGGRCAIKNCRANGRTKFLAVEHDHKCDKGHDPKDWCRSCVRGLTCSMHNGWLGRAGDDPEVFDCLADYLRNPPARRVLFPEEDYDYTEGGMW